MMVMCQNDVLMEVSITPAGWPSNGCHKLLSLG